MTAYTLSNGVAFESPYTLQQALELMMSVQTPSNFATSLYEQSRRSLSDKQVAWVHKLAVDAANPQVIEKVELGQDFSQISSLFTHASKTGKLKNPAIRFEVNGQPLRLSLAGSRSKYAGCIQVTDGGGWDNNKWYGRIEKDGKFQPSRSTPAWVVDFLKVFAASPSKAAHEYGARTGRCCFCNQTLTERSADAGFGDTCAKSYGLLEDWKFYTQEARRNLRLNTRRDAGELVN